MKHPTNKQERRDIERRKLENLYNNGGNSGYPCRVRFVISNCTDCETDPYGCCTDCEYNCYTDRNKGRLICWRRPKQADYYITKEYSNKHSSQQNVTKFYKKYSNKKVRKTNYRLKRNQYRKVFAYWYILW